MLEAGIMLIEAIYNGYNVRTQMECTFLLHCQKIKHINNEIGPVLCTAYRYVALHCFCRLIHMTALLKYHVTHLTL